MHDFQPLAINGIRLLKIQPNLRNGHIACTLNQYHGYSPPYDALSYYWGDPKPTRKIYVNDSLVDIHEALWEFLNQMQRSQETKTWIWTDFLCLDQRNNEELGQQVPRMGQIYSQAKRTISWLGCDRSSWASRPDGLSLPSLNLEEDLRFISEKVTAKGAAIESFFAQTKLLRWTYVTKLMMDQRDAYRNLPRPIKEVVQLSQGYMIQPILNTLSVPYWTRVWVVQEVALAQKVTLMFGGVSIDFNEFLLAYKAYFYYMLPKKPSERVQLRVPIEARSAVHENNVSFQQVVQWGQGCNASKPVDRIYGLLGLLACCSNGTNTLPRSLTGTIDYTRDLREIFWDIALTRPFEIDSSSIDENEYIEVAERWVNLLPTVGQILTCPFTPESLRYADNERATDLSRNKARIALALVDVCRQAVMTDSSILIKETGAFSRQFPTSWPTKRSARRLLSYHSENWKVKDFSFQRLLGSLLLETSKDADMDEEDEYHAALVGWEMSKWERCRGLWDCVPNQSILDSTWSAPGIGFDLSLDCAIGPASSQLPCSLSTTTSSSPSQLSHQCRAPERYLLIHRHRQGATWKLSLEDLYKRQQGDKYWRGTLRVKCLIP